MKQAPSGKKYIRCPCNCLLVCKSSAQRVGCPRQNCKRIINLTPEIPRSFSSGTNTENNIISSVPGMCHVTCAHCFEAFLFNTLSNTLARCPHCRKVSTVSARFSRMRSTVFMMLFAIVLASAIGVTLSTHIYFHHTPGFIALDVILFILAFVILLRALFYMSMKLSVVEILNS